MPPEVLGLLVRYPETWYTAPEVTIILGSLNGRDVHEELRRLARHGEVSESRNDQGESVYRFFK